MRLSLIGEVDGNYVLGISRHGCELLMFTRKDWTLEGNKLYLKLYLE